MTSNASPQSQASCSYVVVFLSFAVRTCFVSDLQRGLKIQEAKFNLDGTAEVS